jgi:hypothetical protein
MNNRICLIQLVSEQTMQNVLPIRALRPEQVVHLVTPRVARRSAWIMEAARQSGVSAPSSTVQLSPMPTITETAQEVLRLVSEAKAAGITPIVNFTGGTKLMSVGAFAAASKGQATALYVDTEHNVFVDAHTGPALAPLMENNLSFTPYQAALTVNSIAVANGCERVTSGRDFMPYVALASHLLASPSEEQACWEAFNGKGGLMPKGHEPRDSNTWLALCARPLALPPAVAALTVSAGLLVERPDGIFLANAATGHPDRQRLQFVHAFLTGGWWEVAVADSVKKEGRFRDIRWSADAGQRRVGGSMEEDILAVDGVQIAYFSCKRGGDGAKLSRQLEEMVASARRIGGQFVRKYFCVCIPPRGLLGASLAARAGELGVTLVTGNDVLEGRAFDQ